MSTFGSCINFVIEPSQTIIQKKKGKGIFLRQNEEGQDLVIPSMSAQNSSYMGAKITDQKKVLYTGNMNQSDFSFGKYQPSP